MFKKLADGSAKWVGAERELKKAMQTVRDLASKDGLEYFIHDFRTGATIPLQPPGAKPK
ncbi:MAG: hypothetical protein ACRD3D_18050 [Terriglobia bacterium]